MHFALALAIAVSFWGARGVPITYQPTAITGPPADKILPKDEWGIPDAMGTLPGTRTIYIATNASLWRHDRIMNTVYCLDLVHEVGHLFGRPHSDDPASIMNANPPDDATPWDCVHWRSFAKRHHIPIRRR
jgi:hypothetical protein